MNFRFLFREIREPVKRLAHAVHSCSSRNKASLFPVNCAAIPNHLEESEFFGYNRGAFTGAHSLKHEILASADGSSLFLDEIGEISQNMQAKLLRFLDCGEFMRIGENIYLRVNLRIISATNRNLEKMVQEKTFRADLFFRLKGAIIQKQPLRKHPEDIPALVNHFLKKDKNYKNIPVRISQSGMEILLNYKWPGNIRELRYTIEFLSTSCEGSKTINSEIIQCFLRADDHNQNDKRLYNEAKEDILLDFEIQYFNSLIQKFSGNLNRASKAAGMHRSNLIKKIRSLNIDPNQFRNQKV